MAAEIVMPPLSQTTDEVKLIEWLVKEGDKVEKGDPLCEVETDKVTMEVESFASGTVLKVCAEEETQIQVGQIIAYIGEPGEETPPVPQSFSVSDKAERKESAGKTPRAEEQRSKKLKSGSAGAKAHLMVKNLAEKKGIDLSLVTGTGPEGLITRDDLKNYLEHPGKAGTEEFLPLTRNQLAVAENLRISFREIPHFYLKSSIDMESLLRWREEHRQNDGRAYSITAILAAALARTLLKMPVFNGYFEKDKIVLRKKIGIAVAAAREKELFVPVIPNAGDKSIQEIDTVLSRHLEKLRNGELESADMKGGTFTLSNLGMYPVDEFSAIISPKQSGIISVGRIEKKLVIDDQDALRIRRCCTITGSFDHRMISGALGAEFLGEIKKFIEEEINNL